MSMDCSSLSIFTPDKSFVQVKVVTPIKTRNTETLQVVSNCEVLSKVDRVHEYQIHTDEFKFKHITDLVIDQKCVIEVGELIRVNKPGELQFFQRIKDQALKESKFDDLWKMYIAEEFQIEPKYSFVVLMLLNYMEEHRITAKEAMSELLQCSSSRTVCYKCIRGEKLKEKDNVIASRVHSMKIYSDGIEATVTDHVGQTEYSSIRRSKDRQIATSVIEAHVDPERIYDFVDTEFEDVLLYKPSMNSTEMFNPFSEPDDSLFNSTPDVKTLRNECGHCRKVFSNSHNLKLHQIWEILIHTFYLSLCGVLF